MRIVGTLTILLVILTSYGLSENDNDSDGIKGIIANGKRVMIKTADCSKIRNLTYVRNDIIEECKIDEEPIKFFPRLVQIIGKEIMCMIFQFC